MNWEAIGVIAEVIGAGAVIVSLGYLAIQVKSNTRALKANASFETTHSWASFNEMIVSALIGDAEFQAGNESRLVDLTARFYDPEGRPENLTNTEAVLAGMMHRALFQKLEGQYYQFRHGYLEPQIWVARRDWAKGVLALPLVKAWWEQEIKASVYSPDFVNEISRSPEAGVKVTLPGMQ